MVVLYRICPRSQSRRSGGGHSHPYSEVPSQLTREHVESVARELSLRHRRDLPAQGLERVPLHRVMIELLRGDVVRVAVALDDGPPLHPGDVHLVERKLTEGQLLGRGPDAAVQGRQGKPVASQASRQNQDDGRLCLQRGARALARPLERVERLPRPGATLRVEKVAPQLIGAHELASVQEPSGDGDAPVQAQAFHLERDDAGDALARGRQKAAERGRGDEHSGRKLVERPRRKASRPHVAHHPIRLDPMLGRVDEHVDGILLGGERPDLPKVRLPELAGGRDGPVGTRDGLPKLPEQAVVRPEPHRGYVGKRHHALSLRMPADTKHPLAYTKLHDFGLTRGRGTRGRQTGQNRERTSSRTDHTYLPKNTRIAAQNRGVCMVYYPMQAPSNPERP